MTRRGFTLLEVLVALTLTLVVVSLALRMSNAVAVGAAGVWTARKELDRKANAHRWLGRAVGSLEVGFAGASGFAGGPDRAEFTTWMETSEGWLEPRRLVLALEDSTLVADLGAEKVDLWHDVTSLDFDYLIEPGADSRWARWWESPSSAPLAIRLRLQRAAPGGTSSVDTLLFLVGPRG